ncbi:MAG: putative enzyme related to lactoylglutathione lyase [Saprospiraceae bacterium]|jgi:predicted enzyme related to lactoylglutathione lyase
MKIKMVSVVVDDPILAFKFYTEVLNFKEYMYMPEGQLAIVVSPEDPEGTTILLEPRGDDFFKNFQETVYGMKLPVIIMGVEDVEKEYERLKKLNVNFLKKPTKNDWGTEAIFDDTCGNYIQIHQDL